MKRYGSLLTIAVLLTIGLLAAAAQQAGPGRSDQPAGPKTVTLDLKGVPFNEAVQRVIAATDISVIVTGELPRTPAVTMRLVDASPIETLQLLAVAGGVGYSPQNMSYGTGWRPVVELIAQAPAASVARGRATPPPAATPAEETVKLPPEFGGSEVVDLDVIDVPFREAITSITKQLDTNPDVQIVVDDSVPANLRVTAHLHKMQASWVLGNLIAQAGLTYGIQPFRQVVGPAGVGGRHPWTLYIVPKPELRVSGGK